MAAQKPSTSDPEFQRLLASAPDLYLALTTDLTVVGASDTSLRATLTGCEAILGRDFLLYVMKFARQA